MVPPKHRRTRLNGGSAQFGLVNLDIALHRMDQSLTYIAGCDCLLRYFPQRNDGVLVVVRLNHDVRAFVDLARAVRSQQHEFKPIWNLVDAVLDGYARHGMALLAEMQLGEGVVLLTSRRFKAHGNTATSAEQLEHLVDTFGHCLLLLTPPSRRLPDGRSFPRIKSMA